MTDEEYTLREKIREKKRTASGVHHRASRRKGYKGAVKLPFETMGRQARDQYTKGGDVVEINLQQGIKWNDLKKMAPETQRKVLLEAGRLYGYSGYKIAIASDVSSGAIGKLVRDLGIAEELEERRKTITPEEREAQKQRLLLLVGETTKAPEATDKQAEPLIFESSKPTTGDNAHAATTGDWAHAATTGDNAHAATTGDNAHAATTGDWAHAATTGDDAHAATTGYRAHAATTGDRAHAATTGDRAHAATTGDDAHAATTGDDAHAAVKGENSIACALGSNSAAKGALGCWLCLAEYDSDWNVTGGQFVQVDGEKIKADTYYTLKNGEFVEVE